MKKFLTVKDISKDLYPINAKMTVGRDHTIKSSINHTITLRTAYRCFSNIKIWYSGKIKTEKIKKYGQPIGKKQLVPFKTYQQYVLDHYDRKSKASKLIQQAELFSKSRPHNKADYHQLVIKCIHLLYEVHALSTYISRIKTKYNNIHKEINSLHHIPYTKEKVNKLYDWMKPTIGTKNSTEIENLRMIHSIYSTHKKGEAKLATHSKMINKLIANSPLIKVNEL